MYSGGIDHPPGCCAVEPCAAHSKARALSGWVCTLPWSHQGGISMTIAAARTGPDYQGWSPRTPLTLHLDDLAVQRLVDALGGRPESGPRALPDELRRLTDRELTVLRAMATGATNAEIASELYLSVAT